MTNETQPRFQEFDASTQSLSPLCSSLLADQQHSWPRLRDGYRSLQQIQTRVIHCRGFDVTLQFNPGRIVSTSAVVDAESISKRPCFLCRENLPPEQKGILVDREFLVLCNPAPIFSKHFTISHVGHRPQSIEDSIPQFLNLALLLSPDFSVFYNGPKCGASAPDHLHFQASPSGAIPVERDADRPERRQGIAAGSVGLRALKNFGRGVLVIEGTNPDEMENALRRLLQSLRSLFSVDEEPMVNILASHRRGNWRLIIFPRARHRPSAYFAAADAKVTVSPAAVDMGGLIITPVEKDFRTLDAAIIESIFSDVSVSDETVEIILGRHHDFV